MNEEGPPERLFLWRILGLVMASLAVSPWLVAGAAWPGLVVARLDHCPLLACDFVHHYLPQVRLLYTSPGQVLDTWFYPPLLAVLFQGFGHLPEGSAVGLWYACNLLLMGGLGWFAWRELQRYGLWGALVALALVSLSLPVLHTVKWGQVSLLLVVGAIWGLAGKGRGRAAVLGLLAGIKVYPLFFAIGPLLERRFRFVLSVGIAALLLGGGVPVALLGWRASRPFFAKAALLNLSHADIQGGQSLWPSLLRWFNNGLQVGYNWAVGDPLTGPALLVDLGPGTPGLFVALALFMGALTAWRLWGGSLAPAWSTALVLVSVTLLLAPGWHHYFAFLPFCQAVLLGRTRAFSWPWLLALASFGLSAAPVLALLFWPNAYFLYSVWGGTTLAALLVWVGLVGRISVLPPEV